jgi:hypothetical protein
MTSGDVIALVAIVVPVVVASLGLVINRLLKKIDLYEERDRLQKDSIARLERQVDKLEITGTLINRFFSQLPAPDKKHTEIQS